MKRGFHSHWKGWELEGWEAAAHDLSVHCQGVWVSELS